MLLLNGMSIPILEYCMSIPVPEYCAFVSCISGKKVMIVEVMIMHVFCILTLSV